MMTLLSSYMGIRNILRNQTEVKEKFPKNQRQMERNLLREKEAAKNLGKPKNKESPRKKGKRPD